MAATSPEVPASRKARILSAVFYAITSFLLVLVNKSVLTAYRFPSASLLGVGQMAFTIVVLYIGKKKEIITFPDLDREVPRKLFPLPLLYIGNHFTGLLSTQKLSLPMFTVLRKFCVLFTLIFEMILLRKRYPLIVILSVAAMITGAFIAVSFDLSFNLEGYCIVLLNDLFTALLWVYTKEKIDPKELGKYGVLFYNASFTFLPALAVTVWIGDLDKAMQFTEWGNILFTFQFLLSCTMGFVLLYSVVLCTHYNSALTTNIAGALKNISIGYIGIIIGGDYTFSWLNFLGLNIAMTGGLVYSFVTLWTIPTTTEITVKSTVWEETKKVVPQSMESHTGNPNST